MWLLVPPVALFDSALPKIQRPMLTHRPEGNVLYIVEIALVLMRNWLADTIAALGPVL